MRDNEKSIQSFKVPSMRDTKSIAIILSARLERKVFQDCLAL
jgi:hypothetical protein